VSQIVTKESLYALAILAFAAVYYENDKPGKLENNLGDSVTESLERLIRDEHDLDIAKPLNNYFVSGFLEGATLGLATAAAIITHGFDGDAVREAVKAELRDPDRFWPEKEKEAA
jgi:hypothetical protein